MKWYFIVQLMGYTNIPNIFLTWRAHNSKIGDSQDCLKLRYNFIIGTFRDSNKKQCFLHDDKRVLIAFRDKQLICNMCSTSHLIGSQSFGARKASSDK